MVVWPLHRLVSSGGTSRKVGNGEEVALKETAQLIGPPRRSPAVTEFSPAKPTGTPSAAETAAIEPVDRELSAAAAGRQWPMQCYVLYFHLNIEQRQRYKRAYILELNEKHEQRPNVDVRW